MSEHNEDAEDSLHSGLAGDNSALLLLQQSMEGLRADVKSGAEVTAAAVDRAMTQVQALHRQALGIIGAFTLLLLLALLAVVGVQTQARWGDASIETRPVVYIEQAPPLITDAVVVPVSAVQVSEGAEEELLVP